MSEADRAAMLRRMLDNPPWELAPQLYAGGVEEMRQRFEQLRAELARLEAHEPREVAA